MRKPLRRSITSPDFRFRFASHEKLCLVENRLKAISKNCIHMLLCWQTIIDEWLKDSKCSVFILFSRDFEICSPLLLIPFSLITLQNFGWSKWENKWYDFVITGLRITFQHHGTPCKEHTRTLTHRCYRNACPMMLWLLFYPVLLTPTGKLFTARISCLFYSFLAEICYIPRILIWNSRQVNNVFSRIVVVNGLAQKITRSQSSLREENLRKNETNGMQFWHR